MKSENIAAVSTAMGASGVAVIRISGDSPLSVAEKMFKPLKNTKVYSFEPYYMYVGEILTEKFTDFGMCVYFKGPKSYTGEDMVEFQLHGGYAIANGVLKGRRSAVKTPTGAGSQLRETTFTPQKDTGESTIPSMWWAVFGKEVEKWESSLQSLCGQSSKLSVTKMQDRC